MLIFERPVNPGRRDRRVGVAEITCCSEEPPATSTLYQATPKDGWPGLETGCAVSWKPVAEVPGFEQAAVGDQARLRTHEQRTLTIACT